MRILNILFLGASILFLSSCTSIKKLYKSGTVSPEEFTGRTTYKTVFDLMIVPVQIDGRVYRFLFDTGAPMVISKALQKRLKLEAVAKGGVRDSQGTSNKLDYVWLPDVTIGGVEFKKTGAIVADLKLAPEIGCMEIDGILGANLMKLAIWKINSDDKTMFFSSDKAKLKIPDSEPIILPFKTKTTFTPVVELLVNDSVLKNITFDTGYGGYLSIGDRVDTTLGNTTISYGFGSSGLFGSKLDTIIKGQVLVDINGYTQTGFATFENNHKNLLGMDYLSQFEMVLDWEMNQVALYPKNVKTQKLKSFGFSPRWIDNKLIVGSVDIGSEAELQGLKIGDEILKLNRWNFSQPSLAMYCKLIVGLSGKKQSMIDLELADGRSFRLYRL